MATQYPQNVLFSINVLLLKNDQYLKEMQEIAYGVQSRDMDLERHVIESQYGDQVKRVSVVSSDVARIALKNVEDLRARIAENNTAIQKLIDAQPPMDMTEQEVTDLLAYIESLKEA